MAQDIMDTIVDGVSIILKSFLNVSKNESLTLLFDRNGIVLAEAFATACRQNNKDICLRYVPYDDQRAISEMGKPLGSVRRSIVDSESLIICVAGSNNTTYFRLQVINTAIANQCKIMHLPGVDAKMFIRAINKLDFKTIQKDGETLMRQLENASDLTIITLTQDGEPHKLHLSIEGRSFHISGGIIKPGVIADFPTGEVFIAPIEDSSQGSIVINGSAPNCVFHGLEEVILQFDSGILDVENADISDEANSERFRVEVLLPAQNAGFENITLGEFGIGINRSVDTLQGNPIIDEKAFGTAHVAIGANTTFGGVLNCHYHHDLVFYPIEISIDGKPLNFRWRTVN